MFKNTKKKHTLICIQIKKKKVKLKSKNIGATNTRPHIVQHTRAQSVCRLFLLHSSPFVMQLRSECNMHTIN